MHGGCKNEGNCMNNRCLNCDNGNDIRSNCHCLTGQFYNTEANTPLCEQCHQSCLNCFGTTENNCLECQTFEGWGLNHGTNSCGCLSGYKPTEDPELPCQKCYAYGTDCVLTCPDTTKPNEKFMSCEGITEDELDNKDDILYIIITSLLIVLTIVLTVLLYKTFLAIYKAIWMQERERLMPLAQEELVFLENEVEIEKQYVERVKQKRLKKQQEAQQKKEEEERLEQERILAEKRRLEEEEAERRRLKEEEERQLEEERLRKEAEAEAIRQMKLEQERYEKELLEKQKREEEERKEREKREAEERERVKLKQMALQARNQRKLERQMKRQVTMMANEEKLRQMREEREQNMIEKEQMETFNRKCLQDAERIESNSQNINEKLEKVKFRRQQTIMFKQSIVQKKDSILNQKKELDSALEGIDFNDALQKVKNIQQDDVVFLQNLRTPPERIRLCLEAVVMLLKGSTKIQGWEDIKKDISNMTFRKQMLTFDPESMSDKVFNKIFKEYINNPQWNLGKIYKASPAAGAFALWLDATVQYKKIKVENAPLFQKIKELQCQEKSMQEDIDKLDGLEDEEQQCQNEQNDLEQEIETCKSKQIGLKKQATLNLSDIKQREDRIDKLNTNNVSLEEIPESEEDSGSDLSPEEAAILEQL